MFDSGNITATKDFREDSFTNMITNTVDKLNELENLGIKPCRYNLQLDHSITNAFVNVDITFFRVLSHLLSNAFRFGDQAYPIIISITRTGSTQLSEVNNTKFTEVFNFKIKNRIKSNDTCNLISINKCFQTYFHFDVTTANIVTDLSASLSSFEGLGLGLYVAYNKLQLLGSLLECSIKNDECCFSFSLALDLKIDTKRKRIPSNTPPEVKLSKIEYINVCESNVASIHMEDFKNTADTNTTTTIARNLSLSSCSGKRRRILVVDDSAICRKVLSKMLKQYNYDYDEACNGQVKFFDFFF
jgi:CheY-like chemotaxis protein